MNAQSPSATVGPDTASAFPQSAAIMFEQLRAAIRLSVRRLIRSKFFLAVATLASLPALLTLLIVLFSRGKAIHSIHETHVAYQTLLRTMYLQFVVFFAANVAGFAVMRQELDERALHYLLLQPVRRWILIAGKLVGCVAVIVATCIVSQWLTFFLLASPVGAREIVADLFVKGRFLMLCRESFVIGLGLITYACLAMLMGSIFRSGFYALFLLAWEAALPYLPSRVKLLTVVHYLHSLLPERLTEQRAIFELLGEPAPVWMSLLVLAGVVAVAVGLCLFLFQTRECQYKET